MPDSFASSFRELVSGDRRGVVATFTRGVLRLAEVPYSLGVRWRNRQFDAGARPIERVAVPVISIGNITLGGTGKTPMVEWICRWLRKRGIRVTIISRGYKSQDGASNDEALELEQKLPDVPHVQNPDRVAAARMAIEEFECQVIVLDDALQHRRIARDLDIVLLDALEPFGYEHVFPRGTLREPLSGLARADCIVLTRADMIVPAARDALRKRALQLAPRAAWAECIHRPAALISANGDELPLDALRGQRVAAFCGIGNPAGFRHTLESLGCRVEAWREFPDHHDYTREDVDELARLVAEAKVETVLCTRKDLVKLRVARIGGANLRAVGVELQFLRGEQELLAALQPLIARAAQVEMP
jgi:tetraacyldisaccharide 4'-kinase